MPERPCLPIQRALRTAAGLLAAIALIAAESALADAFVELGNGERAYSSGVDVVGGVDQRYAMTLNPYAASSNANLNSAGYLASNTPDSGWIGPAQANVHTPESVYRVRVLVDLTGIDLSGFRLVGYWISDNRGLDILVNGGSTGFTNNGSHGQPPTTDDVNRFELTAASGLVAGSNQIEFEWGNGPAGGANSQTPNPTHIRVEFTEASQAVPLMGHDAVALLVVLLGGVSLIALRRDHA